MRNHFFLNFEIKNFKIVKKIHASEKSSSVFHKQRKKGYRLFYEQIYLKNFKQFFFFIAMHN